MYIHKIVCLDLSEFTPILKPYICTLRFHKNLENKVAINYTYTNEALLILIRIYFCVKRLI